MRQALRRARRSTAVTAAALMVAALLPATGAEAAPRPAPAAASHTDSTIDARLASTMAEAHRTDRVEALIVLAARPEPSPTAGRDQVRAALTATAAETQRPVAEAVRGHGGRVVNSFWLRNMLLVEATPEALSRMATHPGVERLIPNLETQVPEPEQAPAATTERSSTRTAEDDEGVTWGLARIGADRAHDELGLTGAGVRVAVLDSGVDISHPDLTGRMATDDPTDPAYPGGWIAFDGTGAPVPSTPHDSGTHGTHVTGTVVGGDASGTRIGVAPDADLMAAQVLSGGTGTLAQLIAGLQWAMQPTDAEGNPAGAPADVVNVSLGACSVVQEIIEPVRTMREAGIFLSVAVGNAGFGCPSCGAYDSASPANAYDAVAVGATDVDENVPDESCGGQLQRSFWPDAPADWPELFIKPDLSAPGVEVMSTGLWGGYLTQSGTSMATPHVTGTAALMRQADPELTVDEALTALSVTAYFDDRYGAQRPNPRYGWGRIDAYEAAAYASLRNGVRGIVTDGATGEPLAGVAVTVTGSDRTVHTDRAGRFEVRLPAGTYELALSQFGYESTRQPVEVVADGYTDLALELPVAPRGRITGTVTDGRTGSTVPGVTVRVRDVPATFETITDHRGRYELTGVPVGEYEIGALMIDGARAEPEAVTVTSGQPATADLTLPGAPATARVSLSATGMQGNGDSQWPSISGDGRYVAFGTMSDNLAADTGNGQWDALVHDRATGVTERVSVAHDGGPLDGFALVPSLNEDGRYVSFTSDATNVVPGHTTTTPDAYVRDRHDGGTELITIGYDGSPADGNTLAPAPMSADGRYVALASYATNLVPDDGNDVLDVFVHDRVTGDTERISTAYGGGDADGRSVDPSISADGRHVAFVSSASNLIDGGHDGQAVYVHDRETGRTVLVPAPASFGTGFPAISGDGRTVVFESGSQLYAHDLDTGETELVSVSYDGEDGADGTVGSGVPNHDGSQVTFQSFASNLVPGVTNRANDIYLRDRATGTTVRVTNGLDGEPDGYSYGPSFSADGRFLTFYSRATNLVHGDSNGAFDVFVHDLQADQPQPRFAVWDLQVRQEEVRPRQPVIIMARVKNVGAVTGTYEAALLLNGEVVQTTAQEVGPDRTRWVRFQVRPTEPGDYQVIVGPTSGGFTVHR